MEATPATPKTLTFDEAVAYVAQPDHAAFVYVPVFDEQNPEEATGARVLVLFSDAEGIKLHYAAGPLFMHAFFEDEVMPVAEVPEKARALRYIPTLYQEEYFTTNLQAAIQALMENARTIMDGKVPQKRKVIPLNVV